jgi:hypothetical protein
MQREPRTVDLPIAKEICIEARALVGLTGRHVLLEILANRLGVGWEQALKGRRPRKPDGMDRGRLWQCRPAGGRVPAEAGG